MPQKQQELAFLAAHEADTGFETNFAVKKFLELSPADQETLYAKIFSEDNEKIAEAAKTLLNLVLDNLEEMGNFVHPGIDTWIIWPQDCKPKAVYIYLHFKHNLRKNPDGTFAIGPIDMQI